MASDASTTSGADSIVNLVKVSESEQCLESINGARRDGNKPALNNITLRHECSMCNRDYISLKTLEKHMLSHSNEEKGDDPPIVLNETRRFECNVCLRVFISGRSLRKHMLSHSDEEKVEVYTEMLQKSCDEPTSVPENLLRESFSCDACERNYLSKGSLVRHKKVMHGEGWKADVGTVPVKESLEDGVLHSCENCGSTFVGREALTSHQELEHGIFIVDGKEMVVQYKLQSELGGVVEEEKDRSVADGPGTAATEGPNVSPALENPGDPTFAEGQEGGTVPQLSDVTPDIQYLCQDCDSIFEDKTAIVEHFREMHDLVFNENEIESFGESPDVEVCMESGGQGEEEPSGPRLEPSESTELGQNQPMDCSEKVPVVKQEQGLSDSAGYEVEGICSDRPEPSDQEIRDSEIFVCEQCHVGFMTAESLRVHVSKHKNVSKPSYACQRCGKLFETNSERKLHMKSHRENSEKKIYHCEECGKEFLHTQRKKIRTHLQSHTGKKHVKCKYCNELFLRPCHLASHQKSCSDGKKDVKEYKCDLCQKTFTQNSHLVTHIRGHNGDKRYECNYCGKRFLMSSHLKGHIRGSHTDDRPYKCTYNECTKAFHSSSHLKTHIMSHTGERPHECPICKKRFLQSTHLKTHVSSAHLPKSDWVTKHSCDYCGKKFLQSSHLKSHLRTHTGELPYQCQICCKRFRNSSHFRVHKCLGIYDRGVARVEQIPSVEPNVPLITQVLSMKGHVDSNCEDVTSHIELQSTSAVESWQSALDVLSDVVDKQNKSSDKQTSQAVYVEVEAGPSAMEGGTFVPESQQTAPNQPESSASFVPGAVSEIQVTQSVEECPLEAQMEPGSTTDQEEMGVYQISGFQEQSCIMMLPPNSEAAGSGSPTYTCIIADSVQDIVQSLNLESSSVHIVMEGSTEGTDAQTGAPTEYAEVLPE